MLLVLQFSAPFSPTKNGMVEKTTHYFTHCTVGAAELVMSQQSAEFLTAPPAEGERTPSAFLLAAEAPTSVMSSSEETMRLSQPTPATAADRGVSVLAVDSQPEAVGGSGDIGPELQPRSGAVVEQARVDNMVDEEGRFVTNGVQEGDRDAETEEQCVGEDAVCEPSDPAGVVLRPRTKPPTRAEAAASLAEYDLPEVVYDDPFYSKPRYRLVHAVKRTLRRSQECAKIMSCASLTCNPSGHVGKCVKRRVF